MCTASVHRVLKICRRLEVFRSPYDCCTLKVCNVCSTSYSPEDDETLIDRSHRAASSAYYMKNSSVECESGSHVRPGRSRIEISITRSPRYTGSVICSPFGLYTRSFCIAMYFDTFRRHFS